MKSVGFTPKKHNFLKGIRKSEREKKKSSFSRREPKERKKLRERERKRKKKLRERERKRKKKLRERERKRVNHEGKRYTFNEETSSEENLSSLSFFLFPSPPNSLLELLLLLRTLSKNSSFSFSVCLCHRVCIIDPCFYLVTTVFLPFLFVCPLWEKEEEKEGMTKERKFIQR